MMSSLCASSEHRCLPGLSAGPAKEGRTGAQAEQLGSEQALAGRLAHEQLDDHRLRERRPLQRLAGEGRNVLVGRVCASLPRLQRSLPAVWRGRERQSS